MLNREPEYRRRVRDKAAEDQKAAERERQEAAQDARIEKIIGSVKKLVEQVDRYTDEKAPENQRKRRWEIGEVLGLWAAALVGALAIIFANIDASSQRAVMQAQVGEMKNDRRAWVGPTAISLDSPMEAGKPIGYGITFQNTGKEPSIDGNVISEFGGFIEKPGEGVSWFSRVPKTANNTCGHAPTIVGYLTIYPSNNSGAVSHFTSSGPLQMQEILDGNRSFFIQGCYAYVAAGKRHESAFCYYLEPEAGKTNNTWQFKFCPTGNDAN